MRLSKLINQLNHALAKNRDIEITSISDSFGQKIMLNGLVAVIENQKEYELFAVKTDDDYDGYDEYLDENDDEYSDEQDFYDSLMILGKY